MHSGEGLFIGLMSGTSLDGVDAVLAEFPKGRPRVRAAVYRPFSSGLRDDLLALQATGRDELHRAAMAANALSDVYAAAVASLLRESGVDASGIEAIGAHGQTVRHRPGNGYTWQINNPARLAEATGIAVAADFRSRDVAAGGQGAPLVPAFHAALFRDPVMTRAVVNIGGIANVTSLPAAADPTAPARSGTVRGWDTGPGNVLLDAWCERHRREPYDRDGEWAASGHADQALLQDFLAEPYFALAPPKSTGRDLFNPEWLDARTLRFATPAADVQATLLRLTADSIAASLIRHCPDVREVLVCGGGARNVALMRALGRALARAFGGATSTPALRTTDELGVPANEVEALAFAWLARALLHGEPGNLPAVTGARGPRILGALYPK